MLTFFLGFIWFFLISMQTRIIAFTNNYLFHASWTFLVSMVWVILIKQIAFEDSYFIFVLYALGTSFGSISATYVHAKLSKKAGNNAVSS